MGAAALSGSVGQVFAAGNDEIKIALIGCGGRGTGATERDGIRPKCKIGRYGRCIQG